MSIGEFAQVSGLTVKALRHYDERGLLVPAHVDPQTRYRGYVGSQVRDAMTIKMLRAAGVPVETVRRALLEPDRVDELLAGFRAVLAAERAAQDAALHAAERTLAALGTPIPVHERAAEPVHFAGVVERVRPEGDEAADERANAAFGALHATLCRAGNPPVGPFWSSFGQAGDPEVVELLLCWPVAQPLPSDFAVDGLPTRTGTLPARRELVATWSHDGAEPLAEDVAHPAFVALLTELDARGLDVDPSALRQIGLPGPDGMPVGVELAVAIS